MSQKITTTELIQLINSAFSKVELGNGIGLYEAQIIDDHGSVDARKAARDRDEKVNWRLISAVDLNRCNSSLSFFDAEGMRFHLPAYLIAEIKGEYNFDAVLCLIDISDYRRSQFVLLNNVQKGAVRCVLKYIMDQKDGWIFADEIKGALTNYWAVDHGS